MLKIHKNTKFCLYKNTYVVSSSSPMRVWNYKNSKDISWKYCWCIRKKIITLWFNIACRQTICTKKISCSKKNKKTLFLFFEKNYLNLFWRVLNTFVAFEMFHTHMFYKVTASRRLQNVCWIFFWSRIWKFDLYIRLGNCVVLGHLCRFRFDCRSRRCNHQKW